MSENSSIVPGAGRFPATRWSVIVAARSDDVGERRRALETLVAAYWKPVYKYVRLRWNRSREDAQDLTQEFFARLLEKDFLAGYDPARGRLRTFLRVCVDRFKANEAKAAQRLKRGGDAVILSLDFAGAEGELERIDPPAPESLEEFFEKEWVRSFFAMVVEQLEAECRARGKATHFRLFERYDLDDADERRLSYDDLAREFSLSVTDVTNYLAWARREFRRIALERLRELCADEEEFRGEARALLGVEPR